MLENPYAYLLLRVTFNAKKKKNYFRIMDVNVKIRSTVAFTFKNAKFCEAPKEKEIIIITSLVYAKQRVNDTLYSHVNILTEEKNYLYRVQSSMPHLRKHF